MSESSELDTTDSAPREILRTVTPPYGGRPDAEMDAIGWSIFLTMIVLFLPLLPFLAIVWVVSKVIETFDRRDERPE